MSRGGAMSEQPLGKALLAGRYRLQNVVATGPCTTLWHSRDEVLARPVAIKVLHAPGEVPRCVDAAEAIERFTTSATSVGKLTHPRIASTYDAGVDGATPYIVTEWVEGEALADVVRRTGPLTPAQSHTVAIQTASAIAYAHESGIPHGEVDGFNVLLCADGNIKLTDFGVASALAPDRDARERRSLAGQDVRAAAALLYLCLTGRSVNGAEPDLPVAPRRDGVLLSPQQVRAGVPRELDAVVMRTLGDARRTGPPIRDSAELAAALDAIRPPAPTALIEADHSVITAEPIEPGGTRLLRLGAPAVLAGVVLVAVLIAVVLGNRPDDRPPNRPAGASGSASPSSDPSISTSAAASAAAAGSARLVVRAARDFDPQGRPRTESPEDVPLAYDGNAATSWETDRYRTAAFGNLKEGVGLVFDLGQPVTVDEVLVQFADPGASVEVRGGDRPGDTAEDFQALAAATGVGDQATLRPSPGTVHRYWLVWITRLPEVPGGFKARVAEVAFTGRVPR
ncbi:MAG: protein kinase, partial [Mycobacteriales bacterium]